MNHIRLISYQTNWRAESFQFLFDVSNVIKGISVGYRKYQHQSISPVIDFVRRKILFSLLEQQTILNIWCVGRYILLFSFCYPTPISSSFWNNFTFGHVSKISNRIGSPSTITSCLYLVSVWKNKTKKWNQISVNKLFHFEVGTRPDSILVYFLSGI